MIPLKSFFFLLSPFFDTVLNSRGWSSRYLFEKFLFFSFEQLLNICISSLQNFNVFLMGFLKLLDIFLKWFLYIFSSSLFFPNKLLKSLDLLSFSRAQYGGVSIWRCVASNLSCFRPRSHRFSCVSSRKFGGTFITFKSLKTCKGSRWIFKTFTFRINEFSYFTYVVFSYRVSPSMQLISWKSFLLIRSMLLYTWIILNWRNRERRLGSVHVSALNLERVLWHLRLRFLHGKSIWSSAWHHRIISSSSYLSSSTTNSCV